MSDGGFGPVAITDVPLWCFASALRYNRVVTDSERELPRDELEAALAARQELGEVYEAAIVESFADRLDKLIAQRVADEVAQHVESADAAAKVEANAASDRNGKALGLAIVSMALAIPLTSIAGGDGNDEGIYLVLIAIVLINIAFNLGSMRRRR